jgi:hypothetical protein
MDSELKIVAPTDMSAFPEDAAMRYISPRGTIRVHHSDLTRQRFV